MGMDASAIIVYGILIKDDDVDSLPWETEELFGDVEEWWLKETGYVPPFEIYNSEGNFIKGKEPSDEEINEYYNNTRKWLDSNPMPFVEKLIGYNGDAIIITSPKYYYKEVEWTAEQFFPSDLVVESDHTFEAFVEKYLPNIDSPKWLLAAKYF